MGGEYGRNSVGGVGHSSAARLMGERARIGLTMAVAGVLELVGAEVERWGIVVIVSRSVPTAEEWKVKRRMVVVALDSFGW